MNLNNKNVLMEKFGKSKTVSNFKYNDEKRKVEFVDNSQKIAFHKQLLQEFYTKTALQTKKVDKSISQDGRSL